MIHIVHSDRFLERPIKVVDMIYTKFVFEFENLLYIHFFVKTYVNVIYFIISDE